MRHAAACQGLDELVHALNERKTKIIPLDLMAAAGMLHTYSDQLTGRDVLFYIDNQSACGALTGRLQQIPRRSDHVCSVAASEA